jgi:hypothetical protein
MLVFYALIAGKAEAAAVTFPAAAYGIPGSQGPRINYLVVRVAAMGTAQIIYTSSLDRFSTTAATICSGWFTIYSAQYIVSFSSFFNNTILSLVWQ